MNNPKLSQAVKLALLGAGVSAFTTPVVAQEAGVGEIEEVVVTGSRIKRADLESVSPLAVVGSEEFTISGNLNVEQKLAELPLTLPAFGPSSNNPGDGTARVDLRGLGTSRTLVLVNGRRFLPSTQTGVVDLNTIPGTLIKQVDIVTGGASAVYGSDALAGVVNFQMIDDFEGAEITSLYDVSGENDAEKFNIDLTLGANFADGRGNATIYTSYAKREALFQGERDFSRFALTDANPAGTAGQSGATGVGGPLAAGGSSGVPGTRVFGGPDVTVGGNTFQLGTFDSSGQALPWVEPDSRFNYAPDNFLQLPQERFLTAGFAHLDLNDNATVYTEIVMSSNKVPQELAPTPAFLGTLEINPDSPFFAPEVQAALDTIRVDTDGDGDIDGDDNAFLPFIGRRMVENGSRQAEDSRQGIRILAGVRGDLTDNWGYDASYAFSRLENSQFLNNDVSDTRFRQAVLVDDSGTACQNTAGGCAPLNVFGPGNISQAAIDFVNVGATNLTNVEQHIYAATVNGQFGGITDAGPISVAFGLEHREEDSSFRPDTFLSSGDVLGFNAGRATAGGFNVTDLYAEINVPIISGAPGVENLDFWAAVRSSDYSNISSNVTSYAATINYAPTDMFRFRGGFQRAVRAPNVSELFLGSANGFPGATDPCSDDGSAATDPAVVALCEASGVPAGLAGTFEQANSQIEGIFGGNANLIEETSDTVTLGVVVEPLEGLDITIDYFDIEIEDAIFVLGGGVNNVLDICYNQVQDLSSPFCQAITRRPDGNVNVVSVLNENIGGFETSGIDIAVNYVTDFDFGFFNEGSSLALTVRSTLLDNFDVTPVTALGDVNQCAGAFGDFCGTPRNETQINTRATWTTGPLSLSGLVRYYSSAEDERITNGDLDAAGIADLSVPKIDAITYLDLSASYEFTDAFTLNFGIKNVTEEESTFVGDTQEQANTFPELYDVIGRRFFLSGSYKFD